MESHFLLGTLYFIHILKFFVPHFVPCNSRKASQLSHGFWDGYDFIKYKPHFKYEFRPLFCFKYFTISSTK